MDFLLGTAELECRGLSLIFIMVLVDCGFGIEKVGISIMELYSWKDRLLSLSEVDE